MNPMAVMALHWEESLDDGYHCWHMTWSYSFYDE